MPSRSFIEADLALEEALAKVIAQKKASALLEEAVEGSRNVEEIVGKVGQRIAALRRAQGFSLQQLAVRSDVSAAAIHKIEKSGMVPTITTLIKLAAALGVSVSHLVEEEKADSEPIQFTGAKKRRAVYTTHQGLALEGITGSYHQFQTAGAIASVAPGANSGERLLKHSGEELVHVLAGEMKFQVGGRDFRLKTGDSLHFSGDIPHQWGNITNKPAELVWIVLRSS